MRIYNAVAAPPCHKRKYYRDLAELAAPQVRVKLQKVTSDIIALFVADDWEGLQTYMTDNKLSYTFKNDRLQNLLHIACIAGNPNIVTSLLTPPPLDENGELDVEWSMLVKWSGALVAKDAAGMTPMACALRKTNWAAAVALLQYGQPYKSPTDFMHVPGKRQGWLISFLMQEPACSVLSLWVDSAYFMGDILDMMEEGYRPLHMAVVSRNTKALKLMLDRMRSSEINMVDKKGKTVWQLAVSCGDTACMEILRANKHVVCTNTKKRGASPNSLAAPTNILFKLLAVPV